MKKILIFINLILCQISLLAQGTPQERYIQKWAPTAVREMYRSGVPASITLAQGILESRYGLSALASEGNNHFGIKCHKDWKGKSMRYDDDAKGECFRVYDSADESFQDHSDFLRYRDRYKFLFELKTTDYKGWAYGLKKAGYATDPNYPAKLIKYIEDYKLYEYDTMTSEESERLSEAESQKEGSTSVGSETSKGGKSTVTKKAKSRKELRREKKARKVRKKYRSAEESVPDVIPASPLSLEEPKRIDKSGREVFSFSLTREAYSRNGVPFITSVEGETYSSIAQSYHLYLKELLRFNDLTRSEELLPGTVVYLQAKKNQSEKGLDKYIVGEDDESLRDICQRFAVKMSSVVKMNGFSADYEPREGDTIILRGKKVKKR
ncbi:MAG TPA: glycoside hydrolase [Rikenellaceae bacterium]|nr:glycoside hydrolase [Rikenellaceae bacterium]